MVPKWFNEHHREECLNAEIILALETEASDAERRRQLAKLRKDLDRFASSLPAMDSSAALIRADRRR